jgi:hypothetical protein
MNGQQHTIPSKKAQRVVVFSKDGSSRLYNASQGYDFKENVPVTFSGKRTTCLNIWRTLAYYKLGPTQDGVISALTPVGLGGKWRAVE